MYLERQNSTNQPVKVTLRTPLPAGILGALPDDPATNDLRPNDFNNLEARRWENEEQVRHPRNRRIAYVNVWPELGPVAIDRARVAHHASRIPDKPVSLTGLSLL